MTDLEKLHTIAELMQAWTGSWSANRVAKTASEFGLKMRRQDVLVLIRGINIPKQKDETEGGGSPPLGTTAGNHSKAPPGTTKKTLSGTTSKKHPGTERELIGNRHDGDSEPSLSPAPPLSPRSYLFANAHKNGAENGARFHGEISQKTNNHKGFSWVTQLERELVPLLDRVGVSLTADERDVLARYHCFAFGNCTASESRNRSHATKVATGLVSLFSHSKYCDMTVRQYLALGEKVRAKRHGRAFFRAWDVTSAVELAVTL